MCKCTATAERNAFVHLVDFSDFSISINHQHSVAAENANLHRSTALLPPSSKRRRKSFLSFIWNHFELSCQTTQWASKSVYAMFNWDKIPENDADELQQKKTSNLHNRDRITRTINNVASFLFCCLLTSWFLLLLDGNALLHWILNFKMLCGASLSTSSSKLSRNTICILVEFTSRSRKYLSSLLERSIARSSTDFLYHSNVQLFCSRGRRRIHFGLSAKNGQTKAVKERWKEEREMKEKVIKNRKFHFRWLSSLAANEWWRRNWCKIENFIFFLWFSIKTSTWSSLSIFIIACLLVFAVAVHLQLT